MLIVFGVFATAIVTALGNEKLPSGIAAGLCFFAAALGLIFSLLDRRNRDLVWIGEEVLTHLENDFIFAEPETIKNRRGKDIPFGILSSQRDEDGVRVGSIWLAWGNGFANFLRDLITWRSSEERLGWGERIDDAWRGKHRVWLPWIGILMFALFLTAGIWILKHGTSTGSFALSTWGHAGGFYHRRNKEGEELFTQAVWTQPREFLQELKAIPQIL
jgi:hypothetical protein